MDDRQALFDTVLDSILAQHREALDQAFWLTGAVKISAEGNDLRVQPIVLDEFYAPLPSPQTKNPADQ